MEDRIEINGVWYVREDATKPSIEEAEVDFLDFEITQTRELIIETDDFIMKGTVIVDDDDRLCMPSIDVDFKYIRDAEYWDNDLFLRGIALGEPEYLGMINSESQMIREAAITIAKRMLELKWI